MATGIPALDKEREDWLRWISDPENQARFYDGFYATAQNARSECVFCHQPIFLDIAEGGGCADWRTKDGDYGCNASPETNDEGTGSHGCRIE